MSAPRASAWRSTDLAVTSRPAKTSSCSRPCSKEVSLPTSAIMRRTPGEQAAPAMSSSRSRGLCPRRHVEAEVVGALETHLALPRWSVVWGEYRGSKLVDRRRRGFGTARSRRTTATCSAAWSRRDAWCREPPSRRLRDRGVAAALAAEDDPEQLRHFLGELRGGWFRPFFFLGRRGVFGGSQTANAFVDIEQLPLLSCWKR